MRTCTPITTALFAKDPAAGWETVTLPHTWNARDGQDGGSDYYRGVCTYRLALPAPTPGREQYIQFDGVNHIAAVYAGKELLGRHEGGFAAFRIPLTRVMAAGCRELRVEVDNGPGPVYPQQADFTFFGGIYRAVTFLEVPAAHFALLYHGTNGVFVTPGVDGSLQIHAYTDGAAGCRVDCTIQDPAGKPVLTLTAPACDCTMLSGRVAQPCLWDGLDGPRCYTACLTLTDPAGRTLDRVETRFGFRHFSVDPDRGFFLNGRSYPLRGVSRHQDRQDKGWAISRADHEADMALIREVGANYIRLAHYQHDPYFYDLCDGAGMVVWAEIPFITVFQEGPEARANTLSQLTELILQNYNHPCICFWGISNEITVGGDSPALQENLRALHDLAHQLDPTRLTTMAQVSMLPVDSVHNQITDVLAYNHYFGWYMGDVSQNGPWLDAFHARHPDRCLGMSEYGAEGLVQWHSAVPRARDYTEEYQARYHEAMLETFAARPYLWSTAVWNMFDFAADARDEGGCRGRNNKGLVTYDRKTKKDAFYVYKAWWSKEPFVHVAGRRFADRAPDQREIRVYSNQPSVSLLVNGREVAAQTGAHVFVFPDVPLQPGRNRVTAKSGPWEDTIFLNGVDAPNPDYVLPGQDDTESVTNWFADLQAGADGAANGFTVQDTLGAIRAVPAGDALIRENAGLLFGSMAGTAQNMAEFVSGMSVQEILRLTGGARDEAKLRAFCRALGRIQKP